MANPFYQQYSQNIENVNSQQNTTHMKDIYNAMVNSKDPMQMFINMAKNNPNMTPILNLINYGYTPEMIFNNMCQARGINPQEFIKSITG